MKSKIFSGHTYRMLLFISMLSSSLSMFGAEQQQEIQISLSEIELQEIFKNPTRSYVYIGKEISEIAHVITEISAFDDNENSLIHGLKNHLEKGFVIANYDSVAQALEQAELILAQKRRTLNDETAIALTRSLNMVIEQVMNEQLNLDAQILSFIKDAIDLGEIAPDRSGLRLLVVNEKMNIHGRVHFFKDATFKKNIKINGSLSAADAIIANATITTLSVTDLITSGIGCDLTVGCNLSLNDSISGAIGNVIKNGNSFITTYPGSASQNTFVGENAGNFIMTGTGNSGFGANVLAANITGIQSTAFGCNAMQNQTDGYNVAFGYNALNSNIDATGNSAFGWSALAVNTTGYSNTALGNATLYSNTTGIDNTAVGDGALYSNITGYSNVAIGPVALASAPGSYENIAIGSGAMQFAIALDPVNNPASSNIAIGTNALQNTNSGTDDSDFDQPCIAIGSFALQNNTTGYQNVAIGQYAMQLNTIGQQNIAIGTNALASNTTGSYNTAVGDYALSSNTTGNFNVAFGSNTLGFNTTGTANTAVGYSALSANITGSANTAVGQSTLSLNTGSQNTAIGCNVMSFNSTGNYNTALGYQSLTSNQTGSYNVAIGMNTLNNNIIGNNNVALGFAALVNNLADSNTAVGYEAMLNASTGEGNIALGYQAGIALTSSESNNIYISNAGVAAESNAIRIGTNGTQTTAFMAGIYGSTVDPITGVAAFVDVNGQLGTIVSSRRFKHDINSMDADSEIIYQLNPVTFAFNGDESETRQYGLIAEEVDQVFPAIVIKDEDGNPYTVQYQVLPILLLNEMKKLAARVAVLEARA